MKCTALLQASIHGIHEKSRWHWGCQWHQSQGGFTYDRRQVARFFLENLPKEILFWIKLSFIDTKSGQNELAQYIRGGGSFRSDYPICTGTVTGTDKIFYQTVYCATAYIFPDIQIWHTCPLSRLANWTIFPQKWWSTSKASWVPPPSMRGSQGNSSCILALR
jgi:hypothetical protein